MIIATCWVAVVVEDVHVSCQAVVWTWALLTKRLEVLDLCGHKTRLYSENDRVGVLW